jgi:hypothetical protein
MITSADYKRILGAFLSADNPQGYINNVADALFAIAVAIERLAKATENKKR